MLSLFGKVTRRLPFIIPNRQLCLTATKYIEKKQITTKNRAISDSGPFTWTSILVGGTVFGTLAAFVHYTKKQKQKSHELKKVKSMGKAAIGGEFELVDTTGKLRKSTEFLGKWVLIYFGFTHCPDVCPEELEKLAKVVDDLEKIGINIVPLFISVDPDRDTPELIAKYLEDFSTKFIGLTGTREQVEKATRAYRVYYSPGPKDDDNDYIVDHTIISYLMNPEGELADYYGQTRTEEDIKASIALRIKKK